MTIDIATIGVAFDSTGVKQGEKALNDLAAAGNRADDSTNKVTTASSRLASALQLAAGAFAAIGISKYIAEAASLSQRYNELGIIMANVGKNAGISGRALDDVATAMQKSGISMIQSRETVTRLVQAQIDLSKATELSRLAQDAAVIGQINSSEALNQMIHGITSAQIEVLRGIGINVNFEQSYSRLAKELGVTTNSLSEQQKMQARLNVVLQEGEKIAGSYAASMDNAGKQMRSTERIVENLKVKIGGLFDAATTGAVSVYTNVLRSLEEVVDRLAANGTLKSWGDGIAKTMAFLADGAMAVVKVFDLVGKAIGATAAQFMAIAKLDFSGAFNIGASFKKDATDILGSMSTVRDMVESQIVQRDLLTSTLDREVAATKKLTTEKDKEVDAGKKQISESQKFIDSLEREVSQLGKTTFEIKKMEAAKLGVSRVADPLIDKIEQQTNESRLLEDQMQRIKSITDSVRTADERYSIQLDELNTLFATGKMDIETYNRALQSAQNELNKSKEVTKTVTSEMDQLWIQAGRNIQSALGNMVFDFFNNGLKGMVDNVKNTVLRIVSEFAGLKIAQTIGLSSMFAVPGSAAASGGAGGGSTGMNLMNLGSMGSSILNLGSSALRTGFGMTGLVGSGLSSLGGASTLGAFGAGMQGGSAGAAFIAAESATAGAGAAAGMGATFAAAAGPLLAAYAATQIGRMLAGDKRMSGGFGKAMNAIGDIPILGDLMPVIPLMNAIFGRGPLKQKETNLIGDFTNGGFSGITSTKFKANGGLARGDKIDRVMVDTDTGNLLNEYKGLVEGGISKVLEPFAREAAVAAMQLGKYLDDVTTSTSTSMSKVAESLGKGKDAMEGFYYGVNIASEKGKSLTDEQIGEVLGDMADTMARRVIPNIDVFRKAGESAADAALRIGNEFETLVSASAVLGVSLSDARTALLGTSIEGRSAFIEAAGGVDALNSKVQYFAQNFLDGSEIVQRNSELLTEKMGELGLSTSMTKEDFKNLVQSFGQVNGVSEEMLISLLDIAPLFNEVKTAADQMGVSVTVLAEKLMLTNQEAVAVGTVMANVGYSFDDIMQVLRDLPAEEITAFVNKLGGIDALLSSSSVFAQNFLTEAELMQTKSDYLAKRLTDLGIRTDLTAQDFKDLVQGVGEFAGVSKETRGFVELLSKDFVELYGGTNKAAEGTDNLTDAVGGLNTVAPGAVASIQQLVTAGLNFGYSMQQISQMIGSSTQDQLNQAITNAGGISKVTQDSQFIKANFMTSEQALAIDMQDLANQLVTVGASTQTTRAEFLKLIQTAQVGSQRFNDLNAIAPLFDSVYDRIETAAQAAANYVPPQPTIINQAQIDAANSRMQQAENSLTQAQNQLNQARQNEINLIQQTADKFRGYEQAMKNASAALSLSDMSPLSPTDKYQEAYKQLQQAAQSGDYDKLQSAGSAFLEASRTVNASGSQYTQDFSFVKRLYDQAASAAGKQASEAEKQLGALGTINDSVMSVAQAVQNLANAQSAYNAAKSSIPDAIYSTPAATPPSVPSMPTSGTLLTSINTAPSNVLAFPSDTQILDFVGSHWGDWQSIYDEAQKYKVSSSRLASVTAGTQYQLAQSDISAWVQSQGLPAFERGTDMIRRGGLAVLHPAEAVTPARSMDDMASSIAALTAENREIRKQLEESNRKLSSLIGTVAKSSEKNADRIVRNSDKQSFYREVRRA